MDLASGVIFFTMAARVPAPKSPVAEVLARRTVGAAPELVEQLPDGRLKCYACGHRCPIPEGREGVCRVRYNEAGVLKVPWGYVGARNAASRDTNRAGNREVLGIGRS